MPPKTMTAKTARRIWPVWLMSIRLDSLKGDVSRSFVAPLDETRPKERGRPRPGILCARTAFRGRDRPALCLKQPWSGTLPDDAVGLAGAAHGGVIGDEAFAVEF